MGYYVETIESDFRIDRENYDDAYRALCELNARNDLKTGGKWPANFVRPADSKSVGDPNKWFAWMKEASKAASAEQPARSIRHGR